MTEAEGNTLLGGKYVIDGLVESGGRGEIYIAHRTGPHDFERKVAVKRIRENLSDDPVVVERFLREANLAAQLHHPNIVEIIELGNELGEYYIVMELLRGKTLRSILEKLAEQGRRCHPGIVARVVKGVAAALDHAHNFTVDGEVRPIVHRDVNLENVFVTFDDQVKLLDFGLARDLGDLAAVTQAGEMLGQPIYLAPECVSSTASAPPRDVYALGVVAYMALSGSSPFPIEGGPAGLAKLMHAITDGPTPRLSGDVPLALVEATAAAMAKDPAARPEPADLGERFAGWLASDPSAAATKLSGLLDELFAGEVPAAALPVLDGGLGARPSAEPISDSVMAIGDDDLVEIGTTELQSAAESSGPVAWADDIDDPMPEPEPAPMSTLDSSRVMESSETSGVSPTTAETSGQSEEIASWADEDEPKKKQKKKKAGALTAGELASVDGKGFRFRLWIAKMKRRTISVLRWGTVIGTVVFCVIYWNTLSPYVMPHVEKVGGAFKSAGSWVGDKYDEVKELTEPLPPPSQVPVAREGATPVPGAVPGTVVPPPVVPAPAPAPAPAPVPMGTLQIRCHWGWVKVDGRTIGNCPHITKQLPAGNHTVTFERASGVITKQIHVGKNRVLKLDLVPKRHSPDEMEIGLEDGPMQ